MRRYKTLDETTGPKRSDKAAIERCSVPSKNAALLQIHMTQACSRLMPGLHHPAVLRWAVNTEAWAPSQSEQDFLLSLLPEAEHQECLKHLRPADTKRALVSRLLQRACCCRALGLEWEEVEIQRTRGRKPFCAGAAEQRRAVGAPNFNFNVSHEGAYAVLASETHCIVGIDVAAPQQLRRPNATTPLLHTFQQLRNQLTPKEWSQVDTLAADEAAMEDCFQRMWSCKEAYVKARGDGLGFEPLSRIHVELQQGGTSALLTVDGVPQSRWAAHVHTLPNRHCVAVVRAPPEAIVDAWGAFKATLQVPQMDDVQMMGCLAAASPAFELLMVEDLVPPHMLAVYEQCCTI